MPEETHGFHASAPQEGRANRAQDAQVGASCATRAQPQSTRASRATKLAFVTFKPSLPSALAIVPQTFLAGVPPALTRELLEAGRRVDVPAGAQLQHRPKTPGVAIVLEGLVRVFLQSSRDRQVTVRYARPGECLGLVHLFGGKFEVQTQAVTAAALWLLPPKRLRSLAQTSAPLAVAIAEECAARVADAIEEITLLTFGSVRQHVARHLLDLAAKDPRADGLIAAVTQQDLADATGSVREVVARVLKKLDALGLTRRSAKGVIIVDAAGLDAEARGHVP
jgi:CRP/FNR family transcriptional regulator, cyclic AMP receptor protein